MMKKMLFIFSVGIGVLLAVITLGQARIVVGEALETIEPQAKMAGSDHLWIAKYGGSGSYFFSSVTQENDGGFIMAGRATPDEWSKTDIWVIKLNGDGSIAWEKTYGGEGFDEAYFIGQTTIGDVYVVGNTYSFSLNGSTDVWILKLGASGNIIWQKTLGKAQTFEHLLNVNITNNEELLITLSGEGLQTILLRIGTDGSFVWQTPYPTLPSRLILVKELDNEDLLLAGSNWLMRLDSAGHLLWQKIFEEAGNPNMLEIHDVQPTYDDGFVIAGNESYDDSGIWFAKLTSDGDVVWQKTYNYSFYDDILGLQQTSDDGYIVWGHGAVNNDWGESFILKLDENGEVLWQNLYDNTSEISVRELQLVEVKELTTGGFVAVGGVDVGEGKTEAWGLKLDANGNVADCDQIRPQAPSVDTIELTSGDAFTATITTTLSFSDTFISPQATAVNITFVCGGNQQVTVNNIFTTSGLPEHILVSLANPLTNISILPKFTLDGGETWDSIGYHAFSPYIVGIVPRSDPQVPVRLFSAYPISLNQHTLYRSGDWGQTWAGAFIDSGYYSFAVSPKNSQRMYWSFVWTDPCGPPFCDPPLYTELHQSTDGGVNWTLEFSTIYQIIRQIAPSPVNDGDGFFAIDSYFDNNRHWVRFGSTDYLTFPIDLIALDAVDANRIYGVANDFSSGQTSPDGGQTWIPWASAPPLACVQLMAHPILNNTIYLRCAAGLFRSPDGGNTWEQITTGQGDTLAPHLGIPGQILWSHDGCLLASDNHGNNWTILNCFNSFSHQMFLPILSK